MIRVDFYDIFHPRNGKKRTRKISSQYSAASSVIFYSGHNILMLPAIVVENRKICIKTLLEKVLLD